MLEATDKVVYEWTHHIVSGHTLKHLSAAMVPVFLTFMLAKRSVDSERYMHICSTKLLIISDLIFSEFELSARIRPLIVRSCDIVNTKMSWY